MDSSKTGGAPWAAEQGAAAALRDDQVEQQQFQSRHAHQVA